MKLYSFETAKLSTNRIKREERSLSLTLTRCRFTHCGLMYCDVSQPMTTATTNTESND